MDALRKMIRETLIAALVNEGAFGFMDLEPSVGLVIGQKANHIFLYLFDFKKQVCVGSVTLKKTSDRMWYIDTVAAEKGLGPLMYEISMMAVYPAGIGVGGPTNHKAFDVFNKFEHGRGDIRKIKLTPKDKEYTSVYRNNELEDYLANMIFMRTKSLWFDKLMERGRRLMDETGVDVDFIDERCQGYFLYRYNFS